MIARFYSFTKRQNSTKIPTNEAYTEIECRLKEETSILRPTLLLTGNNFNYNYVYIPSFGRYYFVEDIASYANNLTAVTLTVDKLGSHRAGIGNSVNFIERSSTGWDKQIIDSLCNTKTTLQQAVTSYAAGFMNNTGCYILTVLSDTSGDTGFTSSYLLNKTDLQQVAQLVLTLDTGTWLSNTFFNPQDCLISCIWLPLDFNTVFASCCEQTVGTLHLGAYDTMLPIAKVTNPLFATSFNISITPRYTDFRLSDGYTKLSVFVPMYGIVDLPIGDYRNIIEGSSNLLVTYTVDVPSGGCTFNFMIAGGATPLKIGQNITHQLGVTVPIGSVQTSASSAGGIGGAISGGSAGGVSGVIDMVAGVVTSVVNMALPTQGYRVNGEISNRSILSSGLSFVLIETTIDTEDPDDANYIAFWGRPVCLTQAVNTHSGFVKCQNAHISINGFDNERDDIEAMMNEGIYYE